VVFVDRKKSDFFAVTHKKKGKKKHPPPCGSGVCLRWCRSERAPEVPPPLSGARPPPAAGRCRRRSPLCPPAPPPRRPSGPGHRPRVEGAEGDCGWRSAVFFFGPGHWLGSGVGVAPLVSNKTHTQLPSPPRRLTSYPNEHPPPVRTAPLASKGRPLEHSFCLGGEKVFCICKKNTQM